MFLTQSDKSTKSTLCVRVTMQNSSSYLLLIFAVTDNFEKQIFIHGLKSKGKRNSFKQREYWCKHTHAYTMSTFNTAAPVHQYTAAAPLLVFDNSHFFEKSLMLSMPNTSHSFS